MQGLCGELGVPEAAVGPAAGDGADDGIRGKGAATFRLVLLFVALAVAGVFHDYQGLGRELASHCSAVGWFDVDK